jgi:TetR/AcrR family transcriptional regulator, transcriptional repressor for nem operon
MKVSRETVAEHRRRILESAARLFRERGFDGVTVAEVMQAAGLTHGGFYGHFASKEALIAAAVAHALPATEPPAQPREAALAFADGYLSPRHRDDRENCCMFSSLGPEAARGSADLRRAMTDSVRRRIEDFGPAAKGGDGEERRRAAIAAWSAMVGAIVLARVIDDEALSQEILAATRAALPLG